MYIKDLPLSLVNAEAGIYADDATIWSTGGTREAIQRTLQDTLNSINTWLWYQIQQNPSNDLLVRLKSSIVQAKTIWICI